MSDVAKKYFEYADAKARLLFAEYKKLQENYKDAEMRANEYPVRSGLIDADYRSKSIRAQARLMEAREALEEKNKEFNKLYDELKLYTKELEKDLVAANEVDPKKLDHDTIYLLESGILNASEYAKLYNDNSGNPTMQRIIKKHIDDAARNISTNDTSTESINMRVLASQTKGDDTIDNYNIILDIFGRTLRNKRMCDEWDNLAAPIIAEYVEY